jgi:hypothetical protein
MVLRGQDAWRKHPLIAGCWKKPFPGLGIATGLFAVYCVMDWTFSAATAPPLLKTAHKPKFAFEDAGDLGDTMPEGHRTGGGH